MKDKVGNIIYIGKSKKLRGRVLSYFQNNKNHTPKIKEMVNNIDSFTYILTDTEIEALHLESDLIKEKQPMYNRLLKNIKRYCYIKVTLNERFPRIVTTYEKTDDKGIYFGPFTGLKYVEDGILFIKDNFHIAQCNTPNNKTNKSLCLNYHLGKCYGVCKDFISYDDYMAQINNVISFLRGKNTSIIQEVEKKMNDASKKLNFKLAASYRDQIKGMKHLLNIQKIIDDTKKAQYIIAFELYDQNYIKLFLIKGNMIKGIKKFNYKLLGRNKTILEIINLVTENLLQEHYSKKIYVNKENIDEILIISSYLKKKSEGIDYIKIPRKVNLFDEVDKLDTEVIELVNKLLNSNEK